MPKRRVRNLDGIRIELNERERELIEQAILVNGISGVARGLGNAVGGLGLGLGLVGAVIIWKEGADWVKDKMDLGTAEWIADNCSQEKYNAYLQERVNQWIKAAKKAGRYEPALGDQENLSWWRELNPKTRTSNPGPLRWTDWEAKAYPGKPQMLYDEWCNEKKAAITIKRRALVGTLFPPLNIIGIAQYGFMDWFSGRK